MEGEENNDEVKRGFKNVEVNFDSDEDEPIGSLLKLKRPRKKKKLKKDPLASDQGILAGMEDTLASYRKKLKAPKKDNRSVHSKDRETLIEEPSSGYDRLMNVRMAAETSSKVENMGIGLNVDLQNHAVNHDVSDDIVLDDVNNEESTFRQVSKFSNDELCRKSGANDVEEHYQSISPSKERYPSGNSKDRINDVSLILELDNFTDQDGFGSTAGGHLVESLPESNRKSCDVKSSGSCAVSVIEKSGSFATIGEQEQNSNERYHESFEIVSEASTSLLHPVITGFVDRQTRESQISNHCGSTTNCGISVRTCADNCLASVKDYLMETEKLKDASGHHSDVLASKVADELKTSQTVRHEVVDSRKGSDLGASQRSSTLIMDEMMSGICQNHVVSPRIEQSLVSDNIDETGVKSSRDAPSLHVDPDMMDTYERFSDKDFLNPYALVKREPNTVCSPNFNEMLTSKNCSSVFNQKLHDNNATESALVQSHDSVSVEETGYSSPASVVPEENESFEDGTVSSLDYGSNEGRLLASERAVRRSRKRRLEGMAYEGDEDWDVLINDRFLETDQNFDGDKSCKTRERFDMSSVHVSDNETGCAVAVSVGLKAHAPGPVERIRFKETLKRKGGLQEYLDRRNKILGLWGKDYTRILTLEDCGMNGTLCDEEKHHGSLAREIFLFLDKSGYINFGVASSQEKEKSMIAGGFTTLDVANLSCKILPTVPCLENENPVDIVSIESKGECTVVEADEPLKPVEADEPLKPVEAWDSIPPVDSIPSVASQLSVEHVELCVGKAQMSKENDLLLNVNKGYLDDSTAILECPISDMKVQPGEALDSISVSLPVPSSMDMETNEDFHHNTDSSKKIIVIGAGPAGLTAARHLQRQGFSVTVLEARNRIGGRVYTDRTSLSVPVDLGASIITGVEADVATERRPDPSSLICSQLGLELTVLNSDCPLYDVVTGEKVPNELDEAIEEEYNSLLDDMVLLVAQRGEHAMKMSLEDGLEYALKRRRMARSRSTSHADWQGLGDASRNPKMCDAESGDHLKSCSEPEILSSLERRVMDWHYAHLEYGCAALLKEVSLPYWNQDDVYGGFGGAHCMIKGGYSNVVESLAAGLNINLNQIVTEISYSTNEIESSDKLSCVTVNTSSGAKFFGDAVLVTVPLGCLKTDSIKFSPSLPQWKQSSIQRLGFGVLNKVVLEFPSVFWDESVDYFGATAGESDQRGHCFMFWNVKKTVGAPVLIALVVGKAAVEGQALSSSDHVHHALMVLRKLFGHDTVPEPVASVVTDWGRDPFSYGAYSYVAIGSSGEDYDVLGRPVGNCVFFAGEATCKEHPDTVGGAMMSGLREAVRMINLLNTGHDDSAEVEAMEAAERHSECERDEVRDITKRLEAVDLSNAFYTSSLEGGRILTREALLRDMFYITKTTAGRLLLAKKLLNLPIETLKSFAGTKKGLSTLNLWILDSLGKDATQLLRHCVRLLVLVSTNLLAVRLSGIGKTVKEKVCVHTSRDIRAIASQLVNMWLQVFRREKSLAHRRRSRQGTHLDSVNGKYAGNQVSGKPPLRSHYHIEHKGSPQIHEVIETSSPMHSNIKKMIGKTITGGESWKDSKQSSKSWSPGRSDPEFDRSVNYCMSQEEQAAFAAAEAACAAARAAAEAYASAEMKRNASLQLPKIPSFNKFARREQYAQADENDHKKKWYGGILGRQDCLSEIDSRNSRVRDWSVDFAAPCDILESARMSADSLSQLNHSNEIASQMNLREQSGESAVADCSLFTKAWVDTAGSEGLKDFHAIERWQSQAAAAAAADFEFRLTGTHENDEEESNTGIKGSKFKKNSGTRESHRTSHKNHSRGADRIKQAVVDFVASLLMPVYKAKKIDREGYKSIMKKCATKVVELATDAEKCMDVSVFLDSKRKIKIRAFIDKLIERHMESKSSTKP